MATTKTKTEKIIEDITYASSNQSISRRVIYEFKNLKVMLELKSDSYRGQCYARASVLDNLEWRVIYFIPHAEMRTRKDFVIIFHTETLKLQMQKKNSTKISSV